MIRIIRISIALLLITGCTYQSPPSRDRFFNFEPDTRLFTACAFMNPGGGDHDWLEYHPVRTQVREYICSALEDDLRHKVRDFY